MGSPSVGSQIAFLALVMVRVHDILLRGGGSNMHLCNNWECSQLSSQLLEAEVVLLPQVPREPPIQEIE